MTDSKQVLVWRQHIQEMLLCGQAGRVEPRGLTGADDDEKEEKRYSLSENRRQDDQLDRECSRRDEETPGRRRNDVEDQRNKAI